VKRVAGHDQHRGSVPQHRAAEAEASAPRGDDAGGPPEGEPREPAAHDRPETEEPEHQDVAAPRDGHAREQQRDRQRERVRGDVPAHGAAAARDGDVLPDEQDASRVGAAQRQGQKRVQTQARPVVSRQGGEEECRRRGCDAARQQDAPSADPAGQRGAHHQRQRGGDLKRGGDAACRRPGEVPLALEHRQGGGAGDVHHVHADARGADGKEPAESARDGAWTHSAHTRREPALASHGVNKEMRSNSLSGRATRSLSPSPSTATPLKQHLLVAPGLTGNLRVSIVADDNYLCRSSRALFVAIFGANSY